MYLYLLMRRAHVLQDFFAAAALLRECYQADCRGPAPLHMGLVYATSRPIVPEDAEVLGVVPWV